MGITTVPPAKSKKSPKREAKAWTQAAFHRLPEGRHQEIIGHLFATITPFLRQHGLGKIWPEVEVDVTPRHTYVPDLSYLSADHLARFENDMAIQGPPDLVVEVLSPSTAVRDKSRKLITYQKSGVPWYWLIDEQLLVIEYKNTPEGFLLTQIVAPPDSFIPQLFPGLALNLAEMLGELEMVQAEEDQHE